MKIESLSHLDWLESEAIHIIREAVAESENPVMLFSAGKDSTVLAHLALRAFYPAKPPFPLLHIDSTWEFQSLLDFRDDFARKHGLSLIAYHNEEGRAAGMNPFDYGDRYTMVMRTEPLKTALALGARLLVLNWKLCTATRVQAAQAAGLQVSAWTVNDDAEARRLHALGIDSIVTDFPTRMVALLHGLGAGTRHHPRGAS